MLPQGLSLREFFVVGSWGYCITYYKDGVANTIVLAGKVTWNGADYKVDKESYDKLKEYIDIHWIHVTVSFYFL